MKTELFNVDNMMFIPERQYDLVYADMIYENLDLSWIDKYWQAIPKGGIFIVQTDWHSVLEVGYHLKYNLSANLINHVAWKNEFGNFPKNKFHQSHDDILFFSKGSDYKFYPERAQVEKATAKSKGLNPSGRMTKLATSVWTDICLTTVAKERVKKEDGHNIRWQKPLALMERICLPFTDENDWILDPFMGSGSLKVWCMQNNRNYTGIEMNEDVFEIASKR